MDLIKKGDIIELHRYVDWRGREVPNGVPFDGYMMKTIKRQYQVGGKISRKMKLLEINSPILTDVELFDYKSGDLVCMPFNLIQDKLRNNSAFIIGREKKVNRI